MIANLLPTEATHSSLDLFEKPALLVMFDGSFCQKLGPVYSPKALMLEFEVSGDRNNFIDLQRIFLQIKCKIVQSSEADLKHDAGAPTDKAKTDAPYFCNNVLHSLFSDCTVSVNGLKKIKCQRKLCAQKFYRDRFFSQKRRKKHLASMSNLLNRREPGYVIDNRN